MKRKAYSIIHSKFAIFSVICLGLFYWQYIQLKKCPVQFLDQEGNVHTLLMPARDKRRLFDLMQKLFAEDSFSYAILGSKPVAWATYHNPLPFVDWPTFRNSLTQYNRIMRKGWETWIKYQYLFPEANLLAEHPLCHPGSTSILLINEEKFNAVICQNRQDFQKILRREVADGYQLLKEAKNRSLMNDVLESHQALMGIALGYGTDNSWKFWEMSKKGVPLNCIWGEERNEPAEEGLINSSLVEWYIVNYSCPSFSGDPNSKESLDLKREYLSTKEKVVAYYKDKDFLEATLSLLAGYRPD